MLRPADCPAYCSPLSRQRNFPQSPPAAPTYTHRHMAHPGHGRFRATDTLFVCGYPDLWDHIATVQPHRLISILCPHDEADWPTVTGIPHLRLEIDDVHRPCTYFRHATGAHIRQLLAFLREWRSAAGKPAISVHSTRSRR